MVRLYQIGVVFVFGMFSTNCFATHIRAGEIQVERISCLTLRYKITLIVYTNSASPSHPGGWIGGGTLSWGEGSTQLGRVNATVVDASLKISRATYTREVTFSREGTYKISYEEAHRNVSILNIPNSRSDINFYVEDQVIVSSTFCDSSPSFLVPPIDQACTGMAYYHNPGATDSDGDSLSYSLAIPKGDGSIDIVGYADPNNSKFYTGMNYALANMDKTGPPTFKIEATTGLVTWDAPGLIGTYNIALKVTQWKRNPADSTWMQFGYSIRDMQIEVQDCANHPPDLTTNQDICLIAGEEVSIDIKGKDQDNDQVTIEVFSDITSFIEAPAIAKYVGQLQSTLPDTAHIVLTWQPSCLRVRDQPYSVVVKITDHPVGGVSLTRFRSFNIRVIGPAPIISQVNVNPVVKKVKLQWHSYTCQNAETIQVWRRVARKIYTPAQCEVGMPKSLQYTLLKELPGSATTYEDRDLAIGAQYCYRIVARFKDVASKISLDTCLIPQPAKAPVITHVTVEKTDPQNGAIRVSWRSPYDIDASQYPPPYGYMVQRGNGLEGGAWTTVTNSNVADTTFLDNSFTTVDTAYHYRVVLFVPVITMLPVDTSSVASSVRLKGEARTENVLLTWEAKVPWSVFLSSYPYHYIYRKEEGATNFLLIDSVAVSEEDMKYLDEGKFNSQPLDAHTNYLYYVKTMGGYGNPKIAEPLINHSQIVMLHLIDTIPPCPPVVRVVDPGCGKLPCANLYSNTVKWYNPTVVGCQNDVVSYEFYVEDELSGAFTLVSSQADSLVVHQNLTDLSKCYRVIAIDWVGNRSQVSETVCGENCPAFSMPNVFTPDASTGYNDTFHAFGALGNLANQECSRFVDYISLKVINRWGQEVFNSSSADLSEVFWDGKDKNGNEMATGVYYFVAEALLKYTSEKKETQQIKGWVQLVR
ncbi:MAG: gliding motility-associated C-terminal domain-containing protein [Cyclobacteriaceae bacterium]